MAEKERMEEMDVLTCDHISFGYENQIAVDQVSFSLKQGDFLCIVGKNGSGKSTLLKGILGFLKPIHCNGSSIVWMFKRKRTQAILFQKGETESHL